MSSDFCSPDPSGARRSAAAARSNLFEPGESARRGIAAEFPEAQTCFIMSAGSPAPSPRARQSQVPKEAVCLQKARAASYSVDSDPPGTVTRRCALETCCLGAMNHDTSCRRRQWHELRRRKTLKEDDAAGFVSSDHSVVRRMRRFDLLPQVSSPRNLVRSASDFETYGWAQPGRRTWLGTCACHCRTHSCRHQSLPYSEPCSAWKTIS